VTERKHYRQLVALVILTILLLLFAMMVVSGQRSAFLY